MENIGSVDVQALSAIVSAAVVLVFAAFTLVTVGGFAAFLAILRSNKRALELAYQALPPEAASGARDRPRPQRGRRPCRRHHRRATRRRRGRLNTYGRASKTGRRDACPFLCSFRATDALESA